MLLSYSAS
ncbi:unnamed protein product, partial [Allacma fusca]